MFPRIKSKKIQVIHAGSPPDNKEYYKLEVDAIVCFDERYKTAFLKRYPEEKIHIIPYPCCPYIPGNKEEAREKLGLPQDALIFFSFGRQPLNEYNDYLWLTNELREKYKLIYLIVRSDNPRDCEWIKKTLGDLSCMVRFERPLIDRLYDYLHASDIHLIPKGIASNIVVSSTVFQCLGSGTPIVIPDTRYVEELDKEVIKYNSINRAHLKMKVLKLINQENFRKSTVNAAFKYVSENSSQKIAEKFINLFLSL